MSKSLFQDFRPISSKEWKQKIQVDLKGANYNETLVWKTNDGIDVKPFYHSDQLKELPSTSNTKAKYWKISQHIDVLDITEANLIAKDAIERGTEHIIFNLKVTELDIDKLLTEINVPILIKPQILTKNLINGITNFENVSINTDIIGHLGRTGNWNHTLQKDHLLLEESFQKTNEIHVNIGLYQNAGANNVQQLAYGLAHLNEYLNHFNNRNENLDTLKVTFHTSIGSNYFFEIAKLRALKQLWFTLSKAYGANPDCNIIATPSQRNKTIYDYNVNMLRTTTECMSAILGGANIICNQPYNKLFQNQTEFGERIARNQLLILKKESYFDAVNNPSDGSYYIESLTKQLSEKALELLKDIESNGGFLKQLKEGTIQRKIKESSEKEQEAFNAEELILLGTNKHPNKDDKMKYSLEKEPFLKIRKRKTLIKPIIETRLSGKLEINRLNKE